MEVWIIEADLYRLRKQRAEASTAAERGQIDQLIHEKLAHLTVAGGNSSVQATHRSDNSSLDRGYNPFGEQYTGWHR